MLGIGSKITSVTIFARDFWTPAANPNTLNCFLKIDDISGEAPVLAAESDLNPGDGQSEPYSFRGGSCAGEVNFTFNSSDLTLLPGKKYKWTYYMNFSNASVRFYGREDDLARGNFSWPDFRNAAFRMKNGAIVVFEN